MALPVRVRDDDARALTRDARIVAIRWDLLEWGLVLDLDAPTSEAEGAPMRRAWLAFSGVGEVTIAMQEARLPSGIWLTSSLVEAPDGDGFVTFSCRALLPRFDGDVLRSAGSSSTLSIRAQSVLGIVSRGAEAPGEYGLGFESRRKLCTDDEMRSVLLDG